MDKQLAIVGKVGPAFGDIEHRSVDEIANAHKLLDLYKVPRLINDDHPMSLTGRIAWLGAMKDGLENALKALVETGG